MEHGVVKKENGTRCVFPREGVIRITAPSLEHPGQAFQSIGCTEPDICIHCCDCTTRERRLCHLDFSAIFKHLGAST